jgi:hypothetical protein
LRIDEFVHSHGADTNTAMAPFFFFTSGSNLTPPHNPRPINHHLTIRSLFIQIRRIFQRRDSGPRGERKRLGLARQKAAGYTVAARGGAIIISMRSARE